MDGTPAPDRAFVERLARPFRALRAYSRLHVEGLAHVPADGPAILAANHTGWLGLDYAFTALSLLDGLDRLPRGLAHRAWFQAPATAAFATRAGLLEVSRQALADLLAAGELVMLFPEGEEGAFRPASGYTLAPFARGFVRQAMATGAPVVPVAILGGEEANPVGTRIEGYAQLLGLQGGLPVPRNLLPRPVKWRIRFLPARCLHGDPDDPATVHGAAQQVRQEIQRALRIMKVERGNPWL